MMIADLIDQDDFRSLLKGLGIPVGTHSDVMSCCQQALEWQQRSGGSSLKALVKTLLDKRDSLHPEVCQAVERILVPGLGGV
ncbi:hypothetical protein WH50_09175 [Pokkaliibacter plantistimulans]|uniref:Uncharacterized protein n=2 Tax=Pseudomonadota TaxID=1224 RepID=A0ABX5LY43_9GAMM|nr:MULTISPECIES: hypothetical protein [Pokkaliibacter]MDH2431366.1 hypothetical protein [Pokkaliibacter sp. MBI-7]PPC78504.1 hypothetical protein C4K68_05520 [Pokkaliibacter plantistimulans]PXF31594.1 hypothetical protein WH50_09175 [Pokkaliibacter plantistimulans]